MYVDLVLVGKDVNVGLVEPKNFFHPLAAYFVLSSTYIVVFSFSLCSDRCVQSGYIGKGQARLSNKERKAKKLEER